MHREGQAVVVEPADEWPDGYVESFAGAPNDFTRPSQGARRQRPLRESEIRIDEGPAGVEKDGPR